VAIESSVGSAVEIAAAGLVIAEIAILFGGVISRYVFDRPLVWSDELASTLFLWLAMLGAVIAFHRDEHMRMTACVGMLARAGARSAGQPRDRRLAGLSAADRLARLPVCQRRTADHDFRVADH
jgi:hypothetical protein